MALNAFLTLQGKTQGPIKGSVIQKGREGTIMIIEANHEITSELIHSLNGPPIGKRIHKPFVITKELDKSSPLLYKAMVSSEPMTVWELKFYAAAATGVEKQNYTVKLTGALITDIKFVLPNTKDPNSIKLNPFEQVEFIYSAIEWTWIDGGITASDQWS